MSMDLRLLDVLCFSFFTYSISEKYENIFTFSALCRFFCELFVADSRTKAP